MPKTDPVLRLEYTSPLAGPGGPGTEEISDYEEELNELVTEIAKGLSGLRKPKLTIAAKHESLLDLSSRLQRAKQVLTAYKVEMRDLPRELAVQYDVVAKDFQQRLQAMHGELQVTKQETERQQIGVRTVDEMTTQEVLQEASKVQDQSLSAVERMKRQIQESKEIGATTAVRLKGQTEQLKNIDTDIMKVKSNLSRADLLIKAYLRKMTTDKIILSFLCLIFIGARERVAKSNAPPHTTSPPTVDARPLGTRRSSQALLLSSFTRLSSLRCSRMQASTCQTRSSIRWARQAAAWLPRLAR